MIVRIITSVVALPAIIAIVAIGGVPLKLLVLLLSILGMLEFNNALLKKFNSIQLIGIAAAVVYLALLDTSIFYNYFFINIFTLFLVLSLLLCVVVFHSRFSIIDAATVLFGFFYICFLMSHVYLVKAQPHGEVFVWLIFISAWGCDTGAYLVGITFGKNKLTPKLSPNKTIEGALGGVFFAVILALVYSFFLSKTYSIDGFNLIVLCCVISCIASGFSQLGDLTASAIKRFTGIKDYGNIIPGHGGIMDRFDSVLFSAPIVYLLVIALKNWK